MRNADLTKGRTVLALCLSVYLILHLPLVDADPPVRIGVVRLDNGTFVDEGYKSFDARNEALFGSVRWSPADEYGGNWSEASPLNTGLTRATFALAGVSLSAIRIVNLIFALGCAVLFWVMLGRRFGANVALVGTLLLLLHPLFQVFGRLALLETKLLFFCLLAVVSVPERLALDRGTVRRWALVLVGLVGSYLTKESAVVFAGSFVFGLFAWAVAERVHRPAVLRTIAGAVLVAGLAGLGGLAWMCPDPESCGFLSNRAIEPPLVAFADFFSGDVFMMNPAVGALAVLGSVSLFRRTLGSEGTHREDLIVFSWFLLPTLFFSAVNYQPERYFLFALPPMLWLALEGLVSLKPLALWLFGPDRPLWAVPVLVVATFFATVNFAPNVLAGVRIGSDAGVDADTLVSARYGLPLLAVLLIGAIVLHVSGERIRSWARRAFVPVLMGLALLGTGIGVAPLARWALSPSHDLNAAAERIASLGEATVLVGDWAPQLGLTTDVRTIYSNWNEGMQEVLNITTLDELGATHVVIVDVINEGYARRLDAEYPGARSSEPVLRFEYAEQGVSIYEFRPAGGTGP